MLEVQPFQAIRFHPDAAGDISSRIAPPYDVLDESDKARLLARDAHNIVAIDLPHVPPKDAGPPEVYTRAKQQLDQWIAEKTLLRDPRPALYLYHQTFAHAGRSYVRKMFIARLRLRDFSEGVILPHEQTFGGPKEDRLALMKATRCNLSPIFGLYRDPQNQIDALFAPTAQHKPTVHGTLDGVENLLWTADDSALIQQVAALMTDKKVYIADGHHRYGTALMYRDFTRNNMSAREHMSARQHMDVSNKTPLPPRGRGQGEGVWSPDHPANFVMFVLASMDDPGCLILPYHRVLLNIDLNTVTNAWAQGTTEVAQPREAEIRLVEGNTGTEPLLKFTHRERLAQLEPKEIPALRELDVAYLHRYLLGELLKAKTGAEPQLGYVKSEQDALTMAKEKKGVALLLNATPMAHLRAVSDAGGLMPQKSTYFHPKLATGMTINQLQ